MTDLSGEFDEAVAELIRYVVTGLLIAMIMLASTLTSNGRPAALSLKVSAALVVALILLAVWIR